MPASQPLSDVPTSRPQPAVRSRVAGGLDNAVARALLCWSELGREIRQFSRHMEESVFAEARRKGQLECRIRISPNEEGAVLVLESERETRPCGSFRRLPAFLGRLGVKRFTCDTELESDQIRDILQMLWQLRRELPGGGGRIGRLLGRMSVRKALTSEEGLHMSCAKVNYETATGELQARNSYCPLLLSRIISAFKERRPRQRDHRAFFRAAPRYAVLAALVIILPELVGLLLGWDRSVLAAIAVGAALLVSAATYVLFQTIAAEEYDKEHQHQELKNRHATFVPVYEKMRRDLETARGIQRMLLPDPRLQPFPRHVTFAHMFSPEMAVGGDYYDIKRLDDHRVAILLADVSGHGMSAAFITGLIKTTLEFGRLAERRSSEFVGELNDVLERLTPSESFAAVVFAIYDVESHLLSFTNAGHGPVPIVARSSTGDIIELDSPLNLLAGIYPQIVYEEGHVELQPGDKLVLCTDGVTDSANREGERFGLARYHALIRRHTDLSAEALRDRVGQAVAEYMGPAKPDDDRTLVLMEVLK